MIELTDAEERLLSQIHFSSRSHEKLRDSCRAAAPLARSLLKRKAIPEQRWRYFVDPALNAKGKLSRKEVFERNGTRGDDILSHGHFLKYLRYFLFGPQLPIEVIDRFSELVAAEPEYPGDNIEDLRRFCRQTVRKGDLDRRTAPEEFFKLALDCGLPDYTAWDIRRTVLQVRWIGSRCP